MRLSRLLIALTVILLAMSPLSVVAQSPSVYIPGIVNKYVPTMPTQLLDNPTLDDAGSPWSTVGGASIARGIASLCGQGLDTAGIGQPFGVASAVRVTLMVRFRAIGAPFTVGVYDIDGAPVLVTTPDAALLDGLWHTLVVAGTLPGADTFGVAATCAASASGMLYTQIDGISLTTMLPYQPGPLPTP
jgi:hypothetical protein